MDSGAKRIKVGISSFVDARLITEFKAENSLKGIKKLQKSLDFGCLESACNNTKAFLKSAIAHKKLSCLNLYREILSKDETNLNALQELNNLGGGKTEKQFKNRNVKNNLEKCNKKEAAICTACLEIGFALQYLNEAVHIGPVLQTVVLNSDEMKFKTTDDITAYCTTTSKKGVTRTPDDGFRDTCIEAVLYLREGLHRMVSLHEDFQEGAQDLEESKAQTNDQAHENAKTQNAQAQRDVQAEENVQAQKNVQDQEDAQVQNDAQGQEADQTQGDARIQEDVQAQDVEVQEDVQAQGNNQAQVQAKTQSDAKTEEHIQTEASGEEFAQDQKAAKAQEDAQLIWKFFLAKSYNRLVEQVLFSSVKKDLLCKWSFEAIKLFCEVINGNIPILRAKSYAYLGQMISKRKTIIGERVPENCNQYSDLEEIWKTPDTAFNKALSISESDDTVLVRYGMFMLQDIDKTDKAIDNLTEAIRQNESYWFAHSCRMIAYKKKYSKQYAAAKSSGNYLDLDCSLLEKAKQDGKFCLKANPTTKGALEYSRILHWLANLPKEYKDRAPREIDEKGIRKAIDVLDKPTVMESGVAAAYKERANCHYLIGELEEALLFMEAAAYSNRGPDVFGFGLPVVFRQLCMYALEYVETKMDLKDEKNASFAVRRLKRVVRSIIMEYKKILKNEDARLIDRDDQGTNKKFIEPGTATEQTANIETAKQFKQPLDDTEKINEHLPKEDETVIFEDATDEEIEALSERLKVFHEEECKKLLKPEKDKYMTDKVFIDGLLAKYNPKYLADSLDKLKESLESDKPESVKPKLHKMICNNKTVIAHKMVLNALNTVETRIDAFVEEQKFSQNPSNVTLNLNIDEDNERPEPLTPSFSQNNVPCNQAEKQYDFMVLHSDEDKDWVACSVLIQLEHSKVGFKGCLPERDFQPDKEVLDIEGINKRLDNIKEGINNSNKILLAVSPDTPARFYEDLENVQVLGCLKLFNWEQKDTYVLNNGLEKIPESLQCFDVINCGGLPLNLNEVREVLADKPLSKYRIRPIVSIQPTKLAKISQKKIKVDIPVNILTAKCEVNKAQNVEALQLLRSGIQTAPIYCSLRNLEQAEKVFAFGFPQSDLYLCYESLVVCYDTERKVSKWVAYHLTPDCIKGAAERTELKFYEEERIPEHLRAKLADFKTTKDYAKGHQRPAADTKYSMIAMYDTFTLTNVLPERKKNTMWNAVEVYVREKVLKDFKDVRIFAGPMFRVADSQTVTYRTIGPDKVAEPTHMYKIIIATIEPSEAVSTAVFIVKNEEGYGQEEVRQEDWSHLVREMTTMRTKKIDLKTIETETGIQFDDALRISGVELTEDLLQRCPFLDVASYKQYERDHRRTKSGVELTEELLER